MAEMARLAERAACFQVHQLLGQGGFGKVLAVTRSDSGERYAMKTILKT